MLSVQKADSYKRILPFDCLCQVFVLMFILSRDEPLASEPDPGDFDSLIHQQQQVCDRVRPAQESNLEAKHGDPDT